MSLVIGVLMFIRYSCDVQSNRSADSRLKKKSSYLSRDLCHFGGIVLFGSLATLTMYMHFQVEGDSNVHYTCLLEYKQFSIHLSTNTPSSFQFSFTSYLEHAMNLLSGFLVVLHLWTSIDHHNILYQIKLTMTCRAWISLRCTQILNTNQSRLYSKTN